MTTICALLLFFTCIHLSHSLTIPVNKQTPPTLNNKIQIIGTDESFTPTNDGELSIVSFNLLAAFYQHLGIKSTNELLYEERVKQDRLDRAPLSIEFAKKFNADVICLQEVEGHDQKSLKEMLNSNGMHKGYDKFIWSPLHPNREGDIVGLCVAWRSSKYKMVSSECFRRGMIVQLQEKGGKQLIVSIANLHLFAKPSAIEGRLHTIASTARQLEQLEGGISDLIFVAGDMNCEYKSPALSLLRTGNIPYGTVHDRNFRCKLSKEAAYKLRHGMTFRDAYEGLSRSEREEVAPVTVCLNGRGPGITDHLFFCEGKSKKNIFKNIKQAKSKQTRRKRRRERGKMLETLRTTDQGNQENAMKVKELLATVNQKDPEYLSTILNGLPNTTAGFPSDHLPIGASFAFAQKVKVEENKVNEIESNSTFIDSAVKSDIWRPSGVSFRAKKRRETFVESSRIRRRHNALLRATADWLTEELGATHMIRDEPLYKWKWTREIPFLRKKMRAPDLTCVLGNCTLVIVEVTVVSGSSHIAREEKIDKYKDVKELLKQAPLVKETGLDVAETIVIALSTNSSDTQSETKDDLKKLLILSNNNIEHKTDALKVEELFQRLVDVVQNAS